MNKSLKDLILEVVLFTGDMDDKSQKVPRTTYPKAHYSALIALKKQLMAGLEFGVINTEELNKLKVDNVTVVPLDKIQWVKTIPEDSTALSQRWADSFVLELSTAQKDAFMALYDKLDDLPITNDDLIEELKSL